MRFSGIGIAILMALLAFPCRLLSQELSPADAMQISAARASTWSSGDTHIVQLEGPVDITFDHSHLTADRAVIWLFPDPHALADEQRVDIALIGNAHIESQEITRLDRAIMVHGAVRGDIRLTAERSGLDQSAGELFQTALALRQGQSPDQRLGMMMIHRWTPSPVSTPGHPTTAELRPPRTADVEFTLPQFYEMTARDGKLAVVASGGVTLIYSDEKAGTLTFQTDRMVLFSTVETLKGVQQHGHDTLELIRKNLAAVYCEGDVRVWVSPENGAKPELRLEAQRAYYQFGTDRAILTDVVMHTINPQLQIPIWIRAQAVRQLSSDEYQTNNVELSTSAFATPTYSLAAKSAYIRNDESADPQSGVLTTIETQDTTFKAFGVPFFWLPAAGGTFSSQGLPLRTFSIQDSSDKGVGAATKWGFFESLGKPPPPDLDVDYELDYFSKRGPGAGLDATYGSGFINETTKDPLNFNGDFQSYFIDDRGQDVLGGERFDVTPPKELRGQAEWQHQIFFPDDWQLQMRLGYVSDPTFLEYWYPEEFRDELPHDTSVYLKRQRDTEAFTLLADYQPNKLVTTSDNVANGFEVERLPEATYHRVGDSLLDDHLTFFSDTSASELAFAPTTATLHDQGYPIGLSPGQPSLGYTGIIRGGHARGDTRQEVDLPIPAGPFKIVPYIFGRYTAYADSPAGDQIERAYAGGGLRLTTAFWRTDDNVESDIFDLHRLRHVIEPELDVYSSSSNVDQNRLFIYDEPVDAINDIQALELALRQRWQTKRGGPGHWRSVDFFTLNVAANLFSNQPAERFRAPDDFRGIFFGALPEASVPRNGINIDGTWRLSDTTAILGDMSQNLDRRKLATAAIGIAAQRDTRLSYYIGTRYIADLNSNITTFEASYELNAQYLLEGAESFDFGQNHDVAYSATVVRRFDRFQCSVSAYYDQTNNTNGVSFSFIPYGLNRTVGSSQLQALQATR